LAISNSFKKEQQVNELVGKMSPWYGLAQYSSHKLKIESDQAGESGFQKVLNTEKIEISKKAMTQNCRRK
jgi:hypothetical protein